MGCSRALSKGPCQAYYRGDLMKVMHDFVVYAEHWVPIVKRWAVADYR